ncbi:cell division site-positioning protein MapZ family protein [Streptococcus pantholopis]|uniref:Mid-cell-anchored protein Z n=1 Tax=Streptococcus pantholopis TaxID=1811193 RepID=A0A172Q8M4_9STRE|nr:cell division site-positioning protein MapZ family protein [Streptococcus pantholopis]AND79824.1 hypothetical protein A0O21_07255 [Streptococcus pantholopis]
MTEEKKKPQEQENEESKLDFEKAREMTVGEAVRKDSEIKAGVTEEDGVLDKYIKQHPEEVASQKFDTITARYEKLDTATLDDFIKQQREELEQSSLLQDEAEKKFSDSSEEPVQFGTVTEDTFIAEETVRQSGTEMASDPEPAEEPLASAKDKNAPFYKKRKLLLGALFALILAVFAAGFGMNYLNRQRSQQQTSGSSADKASTSSTASSSKDSTKEAADEFDSLYQSFFADDQQTLPKNSEFTNLSKLETALKQLADTDYYKDAKSKYDKLSRQIKAVQAVNGKFTSDAIADGKQVESAAVKSDANFDDLSSETLNTGNASLDTLLQKVIAAGREQLAAKGSSSSQQAASGESSAAESNSAVNGSGISGYDSSTLDRSRSRVPYSAEAVADSANSAWAFNPGVLEKIVATSQERGYISGNDYILEPINIINGNGYYNMYKPDGTYLFSINCKTGYFVGNASGYSDGLDY